METTADISTTRFLRALGTRKFALAAFLIPLGIRAIPEIIAGPYPIGFDPINYYIPMMLSRPSLQMIVSSSPSPLYWILQQALFNSLNPNPVILVKSIGTTLAGAVALSIYAYGKRVIELSENWSLLGALVASIYFISLRISWEEFRLMLGTVLLFGTLVMLNYESIGPRLLSIPSSFAAGLSHEFAAYGLLAILLWKAVSLSFRGGVTKSGRSFLYLILLDALVVFAVLLRAFDVQYSSLSIDYGAGTISANPLGSSAILAGFALWAFLPILPLLVLTAKYHSRQSEEIIAWALSIGVTVAGIAVFFPGAVYIGVRLVILLVYPLSLLVIIGLSRVSREYGYFSRPIMGVAVISLVVIFTFSASYIATYPENANPYFSQINPYLLYVPSSMLQNGVSVNDMNSLLVAVHWVHEKLSQGSVLVIHEAFEGAVALELGYPLPPDVVVVRLGSVTMNSQQQMIDRLTTAAGSASDNGQTQVYTLWWDNGKGWYGISSLPLPFVNVFAEGSIGVYDYAI